MKNQTDAASELNKPMRYPFVKLDKKRGLLVGQIQKGGKQKYFQFGTFHAELQQRLVDILNAAIALYTPGPYTDDGMLTLIPKKETQAWLEKVGVWVKHEPQPQPCTGHGCPHDRDNCPRYKLYLSQDKTGKEAIENACAGGC